MDKENYEEKLIQERISHEKEEAMLMEAVVGLKDKLDKALEENKILKGKLNMGTNFYLRYNACPCCGHYRNELHIGKASAGWKFLFQAYPNLNINSINDWKEMFKKGTIYDEYEKIVPVEQLYSIIAYHDAEKKHVSSGEFIYYEVDGDDFTIVDFS